MNKQEKKQNKSGYFVLFLLGIYFLLGISVVVQTYAHIVQARTAPSAYKGVNLTKLPRTAQPSTVKVEKNEKKTLKEPVVEKNETLWQEPTGGEYPKLTADSQTKIHVNLSEQKLYLYDHDKLVYTMIISSGLADEENQTPTGQFEIQNIRGESFFNQELDEGALNYVSFKDYGVYLFHSVPVNQALEINVPEAEKLGEKASHGCIRLSIPDSEWFYDTIQAGTPVEIVN